MVGLRHARQAGRPFRHQAGLDRMPRWSPDGKRIAFVSNRSGDWQIWTINPDGSGLQQLTYTSSGRTLYPVWSPDGTRLAYGRENNSFIIEVGKPWSEQTPQALPPVSEAKPWFLAMSWS